MNAYRLAQHLGQRTRVAGELEIAVAGANLVAREDANLKLVEEGAPRHVCDIDGSRLVMISCLKAIGRPLRAMMSYLGGGWPWAGA